MPQLTTPFSMSDLDALEIPGQLTGELGDFSGISMRETETAKLQDNLNSVPTDGTNVAAGGCRSRLPSLRVQQVLLLGLLATAVVKVVVVVVVVA